MKHSSPGDLQLGFGFDDASAEPVVQPAAKRRPRKTASAAASAPLAADGVGKRSALEKLPVAPVVPSGVMPAPAAETARAATDSPLREVPVAASQAEGLASRPAAGDPWGAASAALEHMAAALESHPDYRVLRRLVPPLMFPAPAVGQTMRVLLLDTETTGLNASRDKVIELALLAFDLDLATGQPVGLLEVYDGLEDPGTPLSADVQLLTGITDEMLKGQRLDEERIADMLAGAELVIAHNAGFDRPFVEARLPAFADLDWACSFADIDWKRQGRDSAKLSALAMQLGWFYDAHRAEMDCHALLAVLRPKLPVGERNGLLHLADVARNPSFRLQATGAPFDAKDLLKARGYRWDANNRVWVLQLRDETALVAECHWLKGHVYEDRPTRVQVERLEARQRYSGRPGSLDFRPL